MLHQDLNEFIADFGIQRHGVFFGGILFEVDQLHGLEGIVLQEFPWAAANGIIGSALIAAVAFFSDEDQGAIRIAFVVLQKHTGEALAFDYMGDFRAADFAEGG